ncbi:MAG: tyrosine-type recombinase/integrase [Planctomycetota bacterium]
MKLTELLEDYLERTRTQIEPSTAKSAKYSMNDFITAIGDIYSDRVTYRHCERFHQYCFDKGLRPSSVNSHIKLVKRIFSLAVKRGQLEQNPFDGLPLLKVPKKPVRIFSKDEFERILAVARSQIWKARILLAKTAGLRRSEILNLTLNDIDFAKGKIVVQPKEDTKYTWRWSVKDKDVRELPLVDKTAQLLIDIQAELPEGQPYLVLPARRYQYLMGLKAKGKLKYELRKCPDDNYSRSWQTIFKRAGIENGTFHDLRSTCITEWLEKGLMPHEVKELAGHTDINTTMNYYVGIRESLIDRARGASSAALGEDSSALSVRATQNSQNGNAEAMSKSSQPFVLTEVKQT